MRWYLSQKRVKQSRLAFDNNFSERKYERYMELVVYTPTIEKLDLLRAILGWIIFLYVLLLLIILSINIWVFRKNMKPLYVLLKWLDTSQLGKKNEPLENTTKITEFRKLNAATMAFAERGEKLF